MMGKKQLPGVVIGHGEVSVEEVVAVVKGCSVRLADDQNFRDRIEASQDLLHKLLQDGVQIYGATTSYGEASVLEVDKSDSHSLNNTALQQSGCGLGAFFGPEVGRGIMFTRLHCLAKGYSGVRMDLLKQLEQFIRLDIIPVIPEEGSVGASGDLVPMSYIAAALIGQRKVYYKGQVRDSDQVLQEVGLEPLTFAVKECLAIINSTTVMSTLACLAWKRAEYFSRLSTRITSLVSMALLGNHQHFHPNLFAVNLHKGAGQVAVWIHGDLNWNNKEPAQLQDRYSLRCAPHVIGVLRDALVWTKKDIEDEVNSVNDNPILDATAGEAYFGGHFYGGYIAFAMDSLLAAVVSVADLLDRQLALLVDDKFSRGLPPNLSGVSEKLFPFNLGFKNFQIAVTSFVAEAQKLAFPAALLSRSTESHNQDKVSMGTISARYALRVMTLCEQVAAGLIIASVQAVELRLKRSQLTETDLGPNLEEFIRSVRRDCAFLVRDRPLDADLRRIVDAISQEKLQVYEDAV